LRTAASAVDLAAQRSGILEQGRRMSRLRIGLAQFNATVGDVEGNAERIARRVEEAADLGVDVVAFPELAVCGYPPEDLLLRPSFAAANRRAVESLAALTGDMTVIVGFAERDIDLHNAAAVLHGGRWLGTYRKQRLPNYGVFDELRYFQPARDTLVIGIAGGWVGVTICEDIWLPGGPLGRLARAGADVVININASPFHRGKWRDRHALLHTRAADHGVALAYVNLVGGQDELVFDGESMIVGPDGEVLAEAPPFEEHLLLCDVELEQIFRARLHDPRRRQILASPPADVQRLMTSEGPSRASDFLPDAVRVVHDDIAETYAALVLGTHDYMRKNGFAEAVLGLSGGIDSALVAVVAADAIGADCVTCVSMPSRYTSSASEEDAAELARRVGMDLLTISIEEPFRATVGALADAFGDRPPDVAEENLQARIRGNLLMALSNKFGWLLLTTGNKSELATGYATLYGDMAGGFALLKDVPKTMVYELARWRNGRAGGAPIPQRIIDREPSAELRPDQKDTDSLPPYPVLDPILEKYVQEDWSVSELVGAGWDEALVRRIVSMVDRSEYKRRQSAPGVKITPRAFGKDRRLPITNRFRP
jgi:NAD+ synthase (glutamine-hydrolysing)